MSKPERAAARAPVLLKATLVTAQGDVAARIRDVSAKGAQLICEHELMPDDEIVLKFGDLFAAGVVQWVRENETGIGFYRPQPDVSF